MARFNDPVEVYGFLAVFDLGLFSFLFEVSDFICFFARRGVRDPVQPRRNGLNHEGDGIRVSPSVFKTRCVMNAAVDFTYSGHRFECNDLAVDV